MHVVIYCTHMLLQVSEMRCKIRAIMLHLPRFEDDQKITPCRMETLPDRNRNKFWVELMAPPLFQILRPTYKPSKIPKLII
jgi:hypothetical protein